MKFQSLIPAFALTCATLSAFANGDVVDIKNAWVHSTVKGQMATAAFMTLTAKDNTKLVGVSSPVGMTQVHAMKMEGNVMKMPEVSGGLDLPAGKAVELKPGGYHIMLMDLKAPLLKDSTVALALVFKDAKGVESKVDLKVPVLATAP
jgi:copper(I)-binding protein